LGRRQPRLRFSHKSNTRVRVIGYLDAVSGTVHSEQTSSVTATRLAKSLSHLSHWYPQAEVIYLVWDNWPVHQHPRVQEALQRQPQVRVIWLPTYAPWLNPIEKLWRKVKQDTTHAHPWSDDFLEYRRQISSTFDHFTTPSPDLLRYVGLST
jgi:transposase